MNERCGIRGPGVDVKLDKIRDGRWSDIVNADERREQETGCRCTMAGGKRKV